MHIAMAVCIARYPQATKNTLACFCMRPTLPGVLYENLALLTEHCMEYTLACIWCYYYDDGLEVVIKAYKFTVLEIWRDFNVFSYIACPRYPYIRVYRLYDVCMRETFSVHMHITVH